MNKYIRFTIGFLQIPALVLGALGILCALVVYPVEVLGVVGLIICICQGHAVMGGPDE